MASPPRRLQGPVLSTSYLGLVVLEPVGLVHHEAGPLDGAQDGLVNGDELIGGEKDVEFDLHFFLEGKGSVWEESWEGSGSRSPETKEPKGVWTGPPENILNSTGRQSCHLQIEVGLFLPFQSVCLLFLFFLSYCTF